MTRVVTITTGRWEHSAPDMKKYTKEEVHTYYLFLPLLSKPNQQLRYLSQTIDNKIALPTLQTGTKKCFSYSAWDPFLVGVLKVTGKEQHQAFKKLRFHPKAQDISLYYL